MSPARPKICYIIPKYDPDSEEHFYHVYRFLEEVAKNADVYLLIEKSESTPSFQRVVPLVQRFWRFRPLRILEFIWLFLRLRLSGVDLFFARYSFSGGLLAGLLSKVVGGKIYYWHCVSRIFKRPLRLTRDSIAHKLRAEIPLILTLKTVHRLVTGTPRVGEFYRREFGLPKSKIAILPNEIEISRFALDPPARADFRKRVNERVGFLDRCSSVVLFVHRMHERKGCHFLPEIVRRVHEQIPDAAFLIAGDGPAYESVRNRLKDPLVHFFGWVPNREILPLYAVSDLFIMPSLEEGFPRVLLECMASGVPFVASDVGGVRDIVPESQQEFLSPPGEIALFSDHVIQLLKDKEKRIHLVRDGLVKVQEYRMEKVAGEFIRLFQE